MFWNQMKGNGLLPINYFHMAKMSNVEVKMRASIQTC